MNHLLSGMLGIASRPSLSDVVRTGTSIIIQEDALVLSVL